MPCLRNTVAFGLDEIVLDIQISEAISMPRNWDDPVPMPAATSRPQPAHARRVSQVLADQVEHPVLANRRGQEAFDVLHHEHRGPVIGDDLEVLRVEILALVLVGPIASNASVTGSARHRVGLARRAPDENPFRGAAQRLLNPLTNIPVRRDTEFGVPSLGLRPRGVIRKPIEEGVASDRSPEHVVVHGRNATRRELAAERSQGESLMRPEVLLDRQTDIEPLSVVRCAIGAESLSEPTRTREEINYGNSVSVKHPISAPRASVTAFGLHRNGHLYLTA